MEFSVNSPIIFIGVAIIILAVLSQSVFFLVRALKRAKQKNMDKSVIKKAIISSAIFTIAPAIAILVGVIALSKSLGIAVPWLRLSVIGSLSYETVAADTTLKALGLTSGAVVTDASAFVTILWVMTVGIMAGIFLVPILCKRIQKGMISIEKKDKAWFDVLSNAMFIGMISAFLGYIVCDLGLLWTDNGNTAGLVPICVFISSALVMAVLGILAVKTKKRWLTDYALPISLVVGMALAIPFTAWLG